MKADLVSITELRDTERRVLNYMLLSKDNFVEIDSKLDKNDFIFLVHKIIFEYFTGCIFKGMLISYLSNDIDNVGEALQACSEFVVDEHNLLLMEAYLSKQYSIEETLVLEELTEAPSTDIKADLAIIEAYSFEKSAGKSANVHPIDIQIDTQDGITKIAYMNDTLIGIASTNLNSIPAEACSNFLDTMAMISKVDLKSGENSLEMNFRQDGNKDEILGMYLKKEVSLD